MDVAMRWHRLLRAVAFLGGIAVGLGTAVFIFSNVSPIDVHWRVPSAAGFVLNWTITGVSIWLIATVPLLLGLVAGYVYHLPARMHHFREHMRHLHRVHELEHEVQELRSSLDKVLMMPEDGSIAVPAALLPPVKADRDEEPDPFAIADSAPVSIASSEPTSAPAPEAAHKAAPKPPPKVARSPIRLPATAVVARPRANGKSALAKPATPVPATATNGRRPRSRRAPQPATDSAG